MSPAPVADGGPDLPPVLEQVPTGTRGWRPVFGFLLLAAYVSLPAILGSIRSPEEGAVLPGTVPKLLAMCGFELVLFGLTFAIACRIGRLPRRHLRLAWPKTFWIWPRSLGWSLALRLGIGMLLGAGLVGWRLISGESLDNLNDLRPKVESMVSVEALRDPLYLFLAMTFVSFVVAGAREELWRAAAIGFLAEISPRRFGRRWGPWLALIPVAVLFGLAHTPQGWMGMTFTGVLGLGLGAIMLLHRSVWDAVLAHGFFNATTFALLPFLAEHLLEKR